MDMKSALCYCVFFVFMPTCIGQLLQADILTQFFIADEKIKTEQNTGQNILINDGKRPKQTDIMKDYLDILLHKANRNDNSMRGSSTRQSVLQKSEKLDLKGNRQLTKMREILSDSKLRGSTLTLFKLPPERPLHKESIRNFNRMSKFSPINEHKSTFSMTNKILQSIWKHRDWKTGSTVKTTIRPHTVRILQTTSEQLLKQKAVDVPPLPQADIDTSSTNTILMTAHSTGPSTLHTSLNDTALFKQATLMLPKTTVTFRPEQTTVTLPSPQTALVLRPDQTTVSLPFQTTTVVEKITLASTLSPTTVTSGPEQITTQGIKTQGPSLLQPNQTISTVDIKPVELRIDAGVTKALTTKLKTADSARSTITSAMPYSRAESSGRTNGTNSITPSTKNITSTRFKQTISKPSEYTITTPLTSSIHKSIKTHIYATNATGNHTTDFLPINDTVSPTVLNETKILVTGTINPFFEKLKNTNFWNDLNKQSKDKETTTKADADCIKECSIIQNVCKNGATCVNSCTGFTCICAEGYSGYFCEKVAKSEVTDQPSTSVSQLTKP